VTEIHTRVANSRSPRDHLQKRSAGGRRNGRSDALRRSYDDAEELAPYAEPAPVSVTASYQTLCDT